MQTLSRNFSFFYKIKCPTFKFQTFWNRPISQKIPIDFFGNIKFDKLYEKFVCQAHEKSVNCVALNSAGTHILVGLELKGH